MRERSLKKIKVICLLICLQIALVYAEEAEHTSKVGVAVSVMLLGSISFMMGLFYLVNHPDPDMQRYSWQVISSTISIFCAVLLFSGWNGIVEEYLLTGLSAEMIVIINMLEMNVWFLLLQLVLALASGAIGPEPKSVEEVELNMKCWAVLFAHLSGFASINALGTIQHLPWFSQSPLHAILVVPLGWIGLFSLFHIFDAIRWRVSHGDDGVVDKYEEAWDEESEEAENDVAGLSLSFVTVQVCRFAIGGVLPNDEGIEELSTADSHDTSQVVELLMVGMGFGCATITLLMLSSKDTFKGSERIERLFAIMENFSSTGFAWCMFFGAHWWISNMQITDEEALLRVALALLLSSLSFMVIFFLDKIADMDETGEAADRAIRTIVEALGILVGFSWEQSFDVATDYAVAGLMTAWDPAVAKLLLSAALVVVVLPAWYKFILPTTFELQQRVNESEEETLHRKLKECATDLERMYKDTATPEMELDRKYAEIAHMRRRLKGFLNGPYEGLQHIRVTEHGIEKLKTPYVALGGGEHHEEHGHT